MKKLKNYEQVEKKIIFLILSFDISKSIYIKSDDVLQKKYARLKNKIF